MLHRKAFLSCRILLGFAGLLFAPVTVAQTSDPQRTEQPLRFNVAFNSSLQTEPFTGRVYVILSSPKVEGEPRFDMHNWFNPPQILAVDAKEIPLNGSVVFDQAAMSYPKKLVDIPAGEYVVQAVARKNPDHFAPGRAPGNLYSVPLIMSIDPANAGAIDLFFEHFIPVPGLQGTPQVKYVEMVSQTLSMHHRREIKIRVGVILPKGWKDDADVRFPVLYFVPGFGGNHTFAEVLSRSRKEEGPAERVLTVVPDPTCYRGHSVFADSETNGPWGEMLIHELIPFVEKKFHGAMSAKHRYVTGVSSGGWSSLWLQVQYPDKFNGCWSHCPDPVDFRDFQGIDLYKSGANMYVDEQGAKRPLARHGDQVMLHYRDFVEYEEVLGPGGQIHSFEAVFSPRREHGTPAPLFDRATGEIDQRTALKWERFDIRLKLERHWKTLEPKLKGKLHVFAGGKDTFYLGGAVKLLGESLTRLGSDAEVLVEPDMGHGVYSPGVLPMFETIVKNFEQEFGAVKPPAAPAEPAIP